MGKSKTQQKLIQNLDNIFEKVSFLTHLCFYDLSLFIFRAFAYVEFSFATQVQKEFRLPAGDFPSVDHFREVITQYNIDDFDKLKPKMIQAVDDMLSNDIPELLKNFRNPYE